MTRTLSMVAAIVFAGQTAHAYDPLPAACDILIETDARGFAGSFAVDGELIEGPTIADGGVMVSSCNLPSKGLFGLGLLVRDDSNPASRSAEEQLVMALNNAEAMFEDMAPFERIEAGEAAAAWLPDLYQLWVFARDGHTHFVITVPPEGGPDMALEYLELVLARYPEETAKSRRTADSLAPDASRATRG